MILFNQKASENKELLALEFAERYTHRQLVEDHEALVGLAMSANSCNRPLLQDMAVLFTAIEMQHRGLGRIYNA